MVLFAAFTTQVGALNVAPVLLAVVTSYLTVKAFRSLDRDTSASRRWSDDRRPVIHLMRR